MPKLVERAIDATVRLVVHRSNDPAGPATATGFFYTDRTGTGISLEDAENQWDGRFWLITNRHVVWKDRYGPPSGIDVELRDPGYIGGFFAPEAPSIVQLDGAYLKENTWLPNPEIGYEDPDIAAIELVERDVTTPLWKWLRYTPEFEGVDGNGQPKTFKGKTRWRFLTRDDTEHLIPPTVGTQVLVIGFPLGGYDSVSGVPIAKSGTIATGLAGCEGTDAFLVDINQFPGSSGSPILTAPQVISQHDPETGANRLTHTPSALIGLHSGGRTFGDSSAGQVLHVGLGVGWSLPGSIFDVLDEEVLPVRLADYVPPPVLPPGSKLLRPRSEPMSSAPLDD